MAQNEEFITIKRSELEELKDFQERMAEAMDLQLGTSGLLSEDLNNPCRESELKEKYKELKQIKWADFLFHVNQQRMNKDTKKAIKRKAAEAIQSVLENSQIEIGKTINELRSILQLTQDKKDDKAHQYYSSCINKLQMAVYFGDRRCQTFPKEDRDLLQVQGVLDPLLDASYKIGCLMALHNPPLLLDWKNKGQGPFPPVKIEPDDLQKRVAVLQNKRTATAYQEPDDLQKMVEELKNERAATAYQMEEQKRFLEKHLNDTAKERDDLKKMVEEWKNERAARAYQNMPEVQQHNRRTEKKESSCFIS